MTLDQYRSVANRILVPFVTVSKKLGLTPNSVSVLAIGVAAAAGGVFYLAGETPILYLLGSFLILGNGLLDLLDGALARELDTASKGGDLIDHVLDRYADIFLLVGFAAGIDEFGLGLAAVTGVLMTSYLGTQAQAVGLDRVYGGVLGRADRLALAGGTSAVAAFVTGTLYGLTLIGWLLVVFAVVGHITALQRFYYAMGDLR